MEARLIELQLKRGDTFARRVEAFAGNAPFDLSAAIVRSQVRRGPMVQRADELLAELVVTPHPTDVGVFMLFAAAAETDTWPLGRHLADIQITIGAGVQSTETFGLTLVESITR